MLERKKEIRFTKSFSSSEFGNVWQNRTATVTHKQAQRLIAAGLAVEMEAQHGGRNTRSGKKASSRHE